MKRACIDCGRIIEATERRCAAHESAYNSQRQQQRGLYSSPAWRDLRKAVLRRGHCEDCGARDANAVHHRFAVRDGNPLICPPSDLLLLCKACHLRRERGHVETTLPGRYKPPKGQDAVPDDSRPFVL